MEPSVAIVKYIDRLISPFLLKNAKSTETNQQNRKIRDNPKNCVLTRNTKQMGRKQHENGTTATNKSNNNKRKYQETTKTNNKQQQDNQKLTS